MRQTLATLRGNEMKYKTVVLDLNRPSVKVIEEPLNSKYGIAAKVYRNNDLLLQVQGRVNTI